MRLGTATAVALMLTLGPAAATVVTAAVAVDAAARLRAGPAGVDVTVLLGTAATATPVLAWLTLACAAGSARAVHRLVRGRAGAPAQPGPRGRPHARTAAISAVVCAMVLAAAGPATAAQGLTATVAVSQGTTQGSAAGWGTTVSGAATADTSPSSDDAEASGWVPRISSVPPSATALVTSDGGGRPAPDGAAGPDGGTGATRVVHRGDSLWSIAADRLGPGATAGEVAAEWPRWWRANRDVIGDDPDVLLPGQILRIP